MDKRIVQAFPFPTNGIVCAAYTGSISHGTHDGGALDDVDIVGAYLPPADYLVGLNATEHWVQAIDELDLVFYSFHKIVRLWLKGNPNVLGMLWMAPESFIVREPAFVEFQLNRHWFASKQAYLPFVGYGQSQLRDMDKGVYRGYMGAKRKALVERFGYDVKHASHLIRLLRTAAEFLETGEMKVDRTGIDAEELRAIKQGEWPRERVLREANQLFARLDEALEHSPLPEIPDTEAVNRKLVQITIQHVWEQRLVFQDEIGRPLESSRL